MTTTPVCANCGKRPGTIRFGDSLALLHGSAEMWCVKCAARAQLRHALSRAVRIPVLLWRSL